MKKLFSPGLIFSYPILFVLLLFLNCEVVKVNSSPTTGENGDFSFFSGKVFDNSTLAGIPQVQISLGGVVAVSDEGGNFDLSSTLSEGSYNLTAAKDGYYSVNRSIIITSAKQNQSFIVSLSMFPKNPDVSINAITGGTIGINGEQILQIPANALSQTTSISVTHILGGSIPVKASDKFIMEAVALEPNGLNFLLPATLQVPMNISLQEFSNPTIRAASVNQSTNIWEELSGLIINSSSGKLSLPINHFSYIVFYISMQNIRLTFQSYKDSVTATTAIANCDMDKVTQKVTISPRINFSTISSAIIETNLGINLTSSVTRIGSMTHKKYEKIHQLQYQLSGIRYVIEKFSAGSWSQIASVDSPISIVFSLKEIGICHDQGRIGSL
ncbi:hypothetical protein C0389_04720 [bacterium]|nr:hypothetical protein [bacterium]